MQKSFFLLDFVIFVILTVPLIFESSKILKSGENTALVTLLPRISILIPFSLHLINSFYWNISRSKHSKQLPSLLSVISSKLSSYSWIIGITVSLLINENKALGVRSVPVILNFICYLLSNGKSLYFN